MKMVKTNIMELRDQNGDALSNQNCIKDYILTYYAEKFARHEVIECPELFTHNEVFVTPEGNTSLSDIPNEEEVRDAAFSLDGQSSPGPDDISRAFFITYWDIIGEDIVLGRVVLAKSILNSIPIYDMAIYKWPQSLIKEGYAIIQNCIWTRDPSKRKGITLRWEKMCKPIREGGLGIRSLKEVHNAMLCKLNLIFTQMIYAKFHTSYGEMIQYHMNSSVWLGIKFVETINKPFIGWIIGNGKKIDFWRDSWATCTPLREHISLPNHLCKLCTAKVSDFINSDGWNVPSDISLVFLAMGIDITSIPCNPNGKDIQIWKPDIHGEFSVKNAFESTCNRVDTALW
ncbi:hypothetical protein GIB67_007151 [Kingdonia uniflora]|uniref:Uncharacterized protein n=1 Tax=Kingdonia uniflora TaxID=39325 RepID=A0A7J7MLM2_9MAGN|nr:hypothetical protein GIB67_007151 [Kingdonia uniflora]